MPNETLEQTKAETSSVDPEVAGRLLGVLVAKRASHHKGRILQHFDGVDLPDLPDDNPAERFETSEKTYRKASDLLYREQPVPMSHPEDGINGPLLTSLADNLAWKGIEGSITQAHCDEIKEVVTNLETGRQKAVSFSKAIELKKARKGMKSLIIEANHFYRDFFESELATKLAVDSPRVLRKYLSSSFLGDTDPDKIERGISMEIAALRYISESMHSQPESETAAVNFGTARQDAQGGDIVVVNGDKILYIDLKMATPAGMTPHDLEQGYHIQREDGELPVYKAIVWSEGHTPVAEDSFKLTEPAVKQRLEHVLSRIR